jgi:small subunit ribosomal protein S6
LETMAEKKLYEGMFLVDSAKAASDWDGINSAIKRILDRANAEIVSMRKWDDRRLAYDIRGVSRGTYILCYFRADGGQIQTIEKAVQLSEKIIRVLILKTDQMSQEDIDKETPAAKAEREQEKTKSEQTQRDEEDQQDDQEDASEEEEDMVADDAGLADDFEETEEPEEFEKTEEAG